MTHSVDGSMFRQMEAQRRQFLTSHVVSFALLAIGLLAHGAPAVVFLLVGGVLTSLILLAYAAYWRADLRERRRRNAGMPPSWGAAMTTGGIRGTLGDVDDPLWRRNARDLGPLSGRITLSEDALVWIPTRRSADATGVSGLRFPAAVWSPAFEPVCGLCHPGHLTMHRDGGPDVDFYIRRGDDLVARWHNRID